MSQPDVANGMEAEPIEKDRGSADNGREEAGKGLILVVAMLPQTVTAPLVGPC